LFFLLFILFFFLKFVLDAFFSKVSLSWFSLRRLWHDFFIFFRIMFLLLQFFLIKSIFLNCLKNHVFPLFLVFFLIYIFSLFIFSFFMIFFNNTRLYGHCLKNVVNVSPKKEGATSKPYF
jgi:hypothetical protein